MWDERDVITRHFAPLAADGDAALGLSDDAALLPAPADGDLVLTTDTLVQGVHYLPDDPAETVASKLLRVNVSDLAAMGARPIGYLLAPALARTTSDTWLAGFADGLARNQTTFGMMLLGGDTTAAADGTCLGLTAVGAVPRSEVHRRSGARPGDSVYVTGTIGDAALGLRAATGEIACDAADAAYLVDRYRIPRPRPEAGRMLRGWATAAIDVSDGLVGDLAVLCQASGVGAQVEAARIPLSGAARRFLETDAGCLETLLTGGDDYELLFTGPQGLDERPAFQHQGVSITRIGTITCDAGAILRDSAGAVLNLQKGGWHHTG